VADSHEADFSEADPDEDGHPTDVLDDEFPDDVLPTGPVADVEHVRDVHPPNGFADRSVDELLDEVADHDTVVLARTDEGDDSDDPRARIPAWEDIVFGVRRHR
jgi:hypothetical protein